MNFIKKDIKMNKTTAVISSVLAIVILLVIFNLVIRKKNLAINELKGDIVELKDESAEKLKQINLKYELKIDSIKSLKKEIDKSEDSIIYVYEKQISYIDAISISGNINLFTDYLSKADSIE